MRVDGSKLGVAPKKRARKSSPSMKSQKVTETTTTGPGGTTTTVTKGAWKAAFSKAVSALKSAPPQDLNSMQMSALRKAAKADKKPQRKLMNSKARVVTTAITKTPK